MKILIAYATKSGATKECAEVLASEIVDCKLCDLDVTTPNVDDFDIVVIGTGIRMGSPYKPFKKFLDDNADKLLAKKIAFFLCCTRMKAFDKMAKDAIPDKLRNAAFLVGAFGGKPVIGGKKDQNWMLRDEISKFANAVRGR
jgi:menaquinone-dependent protoporphyrinogen oxidase